MRHVVAEHGWGKFKRGRLGMTPALASASANTDSIKGLAQSIAKPAYRRLLVAEPALRRAVPLLIITFLVTMAVGTGVQVLDHRRQTLATAAGEIEIFADILAARLDGAAVGAKDNAKDAARIAKETIAAAIDKYGTHDTILVSDPEGT